MHNLVCTHNGTACLKTDDYLSWQFSSEVKQEQLLNFHTKDEVSVYNRDQCCQGASELTGNSECFFH